MQKFSRGDLCPVAWVCLDGASVLNIKSDTLELSVEKDDVSPISNGANTSLVCGKGNAEGDIVADYDLDFPPTAKLPKIVPGVPGLLLSFVAPKLFFVLPMRVLKLHLASTIETAVQYVFGVGMDATWGNIFFPADVVSLFNAIERSPTIVGGSALDAKTLETILGQFVFDLDPAAFAPKPPDLNNE